MNSSNSYSELEHLELVARRIAERGIDITREYKDWITVTLACASVGEQAREAYHTICSQYAGYKREECDEKFDNCLHTGRGDVRLASLILLAKDAGVDVSLPRGRRQKSDRQRKEEQQNRIQQMRDALTTQAQWRFNVWRQRPEVREQGLPWRPVQDRDLDTWYCRLKAQGLKVSAGDVKSLIFSRDFCEDYDACREWLEGLKPWNPDTDPDYLSDFYVGHLGFRDAENKDFYDRMCKKFHIGLVALATGRTNENPIMLIFRGPQHIGKTYFARHILPPELQDYRLEVGPTDRIDKDFIISLSETPLILFDEISFGNGPKSEAFKYVVTSSRSNVRDAYARFRELRQRRASLIATTNEDNFIPNTEGTRRYLVVDLEETINLDTFPLPYEGAYAQALYLLEHGYDPKPNQEESHQISLHNRHYVECNDCEEVLSTMFKKPDSLESAKKMTAGDILTLLTENGHRGSSYTASEIGKAMKRMGFESKRIKGRVGYLVEEVDQDLRRRESKSDVQEFVPDEF